MRIWKRIAIGAVMMTVSLGATSALATDGGVEGKSTTVATERVEKQVEQIAQEIDLLGGQLDEAAQALPAGGAAGSADPNLLALLEHRSDVATIKHGPASSDGPVAILVPIAFFALIGLLVFVPLYLRTRRRALDAQVQKHAIEAGMQYIPELPAVPLKPRNDRRTGALLAGLGLAFAAPCAIIGQPQVAVFGLAPVLLGAVYFLVGSLLPVPSGE